MQILIAVVKIKIKSDSVKILHGREFWGVHKLKSAANFCK